MGYAKRELPARFLLWKLLKCKRPLNTPYEFIL
jgi:hypothetical protein